MAILKPLMVVVLCFENFLNAQIVGAAGYFVSIECDVPPVYVLHKWACIVLKNPEDPVPINASDFFP
eukprot:m.724818 g.724818  ORF g.724818 m.724818 type:complete len:67 (-) comp23025_c2_seq3:414-614(-)